MPENSSIWVAPILSLYYNKYLLYLILFLYFCLYYFRQIQLFEEHSGLSLLSTKSTSMNNWEALKSVGFDAWQCDTHDVRVITLIIMGYFIYTICTIFTIILTLWNSEPKNGLLIKLFFHPNLMKLGEIVVHMGTETSPSFIKQKKFY